MLRFMTAGESHGPALTGILEGMPAGLHIEPDYVNTHLARRQMGYGRGGRMKIERDEVQFVSGMRFGFTLGGPLAVRIPNLDWSNWERKMALGGPPDDSHRVTLPRPGHADYAGAVKYGHLDDMRNVLERASARETAMRVALGSIVRRLLEEFGVTIGSTVEQIGEVKAPSAFGSETREAPDLAAVDRSPVRCHDMEAGRCMVDVIDSANHRGDTLGGVIAVWAEGVPIGLGSHVHWDRRLDGKLAQAVMSIPAIKGVEVGPGFETAGLPGSEVHDEFVLGNGDAEGQRIERRTNRAGGLEGGVSNGELLIIRAAMKPLSTLRRAMGSVDVESAEEQSAHVERSDVCAVPAAGVVAEAVTALTLADAFLEKFGGDSLEEVRASYERYRARSVPRYRVDR
ncbi:MAG: chorismate synthase [bacterium]